MMSTGPGMRIAATQDRIVHARACAEIQKPYTNLAGAVSISVNDQAVALQNGGARMGFSVVDWLS
jgi:hypothetical protein